MRTTKYLIIFHQHGYYFIDGEAYDYNQAQEMRSELTAQMWNGGERDFYYEIKPITEDTTDDDILNDSDFNTLCGR